MPEQIGQWIVIGIVVAFVAFDKAKKWFDTKNGKNAVFKYNPHPPGDADTCKRHGEDIASIKTDITNIKEDLKRIERKINGVR